MSPKNSSKAWRLLGSDLPTKKLLSWEMRHWVSSRANADPTDARQLGTLGFLGFLTKYFVKDADTG